MLTRIGLRNLKLHKARTAAVGLVLVLGTFFFVVGGSLVSTIDRSMKTNLVESLTGEIQIYSAAAKDRFYFFGDVDGYLPEISPMRNFAAVKRTLEAIPSVAEVVPMGVAHAVTTTPNVLEQKLARIRAAVRAGVPTPPALVAHVRQMVKNLAAGIEAQGTAAHGSAEPSQQQMDLRRANSDAFWRRLQAEPLDTLEFLDNRIGPLAAPEQDFLVRYIGTEPTAFGAAFKRFKVVDGQMIPPGHRGMMFNKRYYERELKDPIAGRLDQLKERRELGQRLAGCGICKRWVEVNVEQAPRLVFQLDRAARTEVRSALRRALKRSDGDLTGLMRALLKVDDASFEARYALFYRVVAPRIRLHRVAVGEKFVLTGAPQQGGYLQRALVKVYGTFSFEGLERSTIAGRRNLVDLVTFRELNGFNSDGLKAEQAQIRRARGVPDASRREVEALFDSGDMVEQVTLDVATEPGSHDRSLGRIKAAAQRFDPAEITAGPVPNAAVLLKPGADPRAAFAAVKSHGKELAIQVIDWRAASGRVGQFLRVLRMILNGAVLVIFLVALIVISNSLLVTMMERTREIGTLRAIGASRGFITRMLLVETAVLCLVFGALGAGAGAAVMMALGSKGIAAWNDFSYWLFSGPRLYPVLSGGRIAGALLALLIVALGATLLPARIAGKITPREAMAREE